MIYHDDPYSTTNLIGPVTETQPLVRRDAPGREVNKVIKGNPFTLVRRNGQMTPVLSILTEHRHRPAEHAMLAEVRDTYRVHEELPEGPAQTGGRFRISSMFGWLNTSIAAMAGNSKRGSLRGVDVPPQEQGFGGD